MSYIHIGQNGKKQFLDQIGKISFAKFLHVQIRVDISNYRGILIKYLANYI